MPAPAVESDQDLATRLAVEAGQLLVRIRAQLFAQGLNHWSVKDAGDDAAQTFLMNELRSLRPDDAVLSEEGREDPRRFAGGRVWIVDPLDGTREFAERDRVDWAVHIAMGGRPFRCQRSVTSGTRPGVRDGPTADDARYCASPPDSHHLSKPSAAIRTLGCSWA